MLSGSSEFWAALPPTCVNLQLDTSPFTCFSLGYPPFPLPLLPQPGNKLSEIKDQFNFLLSPYPKLKPSPAASPVPSHPHPTAPTLAPPAPGSSRGWPRVAPMPSEHRGEALSASAVPFPQKGCFIGKRMENCFI